MKRARVKRMAKRLRDSGFFDGEWYLQQNPDVAEAGVDAAQHFVEYGYSEGRKPSPHFDSPANMNDHPEWDAAQLTPSPRSEDPNSISDRPDEDPDAPVPHYGKGLDNLVRAARRRTKSPGQTDEYEVIRSAFDIAYYLARYRDIARAVRLDPIQHYINAGAREGRDPSPHFSTKSYRARYPEVDESGLNPFYHWLTIGRDKGYIAEPFTEFEGMCRILGRSPQEVQGLLTERRDDLRQRLEHGKLGEMVAKAAELDPLIAHSWPEALQIKLPPFHSEPVVSRVVAMHRLQEAADFRRARFVIVVNRPRWGGGRRIEGHILHALAQRYSPDEMLVLNTEEGGDAPPGRFPEGCRHLDFATVTADLKPDARERVLVEFLRSLRPDAVFNVNSRLMWEALKPYGKALSATTALYACLFCNEKTLFGFWTGYPVKQFYRNFDVLAGIFCDSHYLAEQLTAQFQVPPGLRHKVRVLEAPVDSSQPVIPAPAPDTQRRPQVFWSGRFDRQKRVDIAYEIARRVPEADFRMWGEDVLKGGTGDLRRPENVQVEGKYVHFSDLPLENCDLWLYTSEWDGVPSLLIEVAMTGVPLVGSLAGGTGEILRHGMSWPIEDIEDIDAYVIAIREVLAAPDAARTRARDLRAHLAAKRTEANYLDALESILPQEVTHG
ncbi:MAG: Glycosyltransferase [Rhodobacteraceae bacterium HLUCCO07]|nr:MAG: Glycosyltransferase [Rhodobacteraceae bacterium HLUCCO07]